MLEAMSMRGGLLLVGALGLSCYTSAPVPPASPAPAGPPAAMVIRADAVGPITARTPGSLLGLRRALPGYEVKPAHVVLGPTTNRLGFYVYKDGEKLLHVIPDGKGAIATVHALSPRVVASDRAWKMGAKLNSVRALSTCKCWEEEVVVCYRAGDHVAVSFARECGWDSYASEDDRQDLIGAPIHRVLWSPRAFGEESNPYGGSEYGGDEYGGS
jgi:hypothetical protein